MQLWVEQVSSHLVAPKTAADICHDIDLLKVLVKCSTKCPFACTLYWCFFLNVCLCHKADQTHQSYFIGICALFTNMCKLFVLEYATSLTSKLRTNEAFVCLFNGSLMHKHAVCVIRLAVLAPTKSCRIPIIEQVFSACLFASTGNCIDLPICAISQVMICLGGILYLVCLQLLFLHVLHFRLGSYFFADCLTSHLAEKPLQRVFWQTIAQLYFGAKMLVIRSSRLVPPYPMWWKWCI